MRRIVQLKVAALLAVLGAAGGAPGYSRRRTGPTGSWTSRCRRKAGRSPAPSRGATRRPPRCAAAAARRQHGQITVRSTRANELGRFTFPKVSAGTTSSSSSTSIAMFWPWARGSRSARRKRCRRSSGLPPRAGGRRVFQRGGGGDRRGSHGRRGSTRQRRPACQRAVLRARRCPAPANSALPRCRT